MAEWRVAHWVDCWASTKVCSAADSRAQQWAESRVDRSVGRLAIQTAEHWATRKVAHWESLTAAQKDCSTAVSRVAPRVAAKELHWAVLRAAQRE